MSEGEFSGQTVIVSGGSKGIGRVVATHFARQGASLVLIGRDRDDLAAAAGALPLVEGASAIPVAGDVGDPATATAALAAAMDRFGQVDVLANVAGIFPAALLAETSDAQYRATIDANLTGTFNLCRAVLPGMMARGRGAIVNMSSIAARMATPGLAVYAASKAGVEAFTRAIAAEAAPVVRVNAVSAGPTSTETAEAMTATDTTGAVDAVTRSIPLARRATRDEMAEAFLFLASRRASFITGEVLQVNGGGLMA